MGCYQSKTQNISVYGGSRNLQELRWEQTFRLFDPGSKGHISCNKLCHVMRGLDLDKTQRSMENLVSQLDKKREGVIRYRKFRKFMKTLSVPHRDVRRSELLLAFRQIDVENRKYVTVEKLLEVLTSRGECLTQSEVEAAVGGHGVNRMGVVFYEDLVDSILDSVEDSRKHAKAYLDELGYMSKK